MSFLSKIFGDANEKYLKQKKPIIDKINNLEKELESVSNEALKNKTQEFKQRIKEGQSLENIMPEAYACVREAAKRTLGQRHFDTQLMVGIVLHEGKIAEMKTGEGKTLAATLAAYLNALEEKGVHVITVNDYLSRRDAIWMGQIYHFLGLSTGCLNHEQSFLYDPDYKKAEEEKDQIRDELGGFKIVEDFLKPCLRKEAYLADITYGTNNEFGFDYLRDNMVFDLSDQAQRGFSYVIIDEIDSILIDEARTPLIISAPDTESSVRYKELSSIVPLLVSGTDYEVHEKEKTVTLTEEGIEKLEKMWKVENIYEQEGSRYLHYLEQALRAQAVDSRSHQLFEKDRHYVVKDGQIIIVDEFTGRLMPGRRWSGGLHQAMEAKEGLMVQPESRTLATITFQNLFRMYGKLSGMTGTAATSAEEFFKVYNLEVVIVPTSKPMIRADLDDKVYKSELGKFRAVTEEIKDKHHKGQPLLVGTTSIEKNELLAKFLEREGIPYQMLNAKNHEREGEIIAQAGKAGAVTVATNMAGRGVDIVLGGNPPNKQEAQKVIDLGGLHVIGTERHEARRIDNQLRGRSGRQGDPGSSQFFVSLEDDVLRLFGTDRIKSLMNILKIPEDQPIEAKMVSGALESAQSKIEGLHFDARKHLLEYDDVVNKHRTRIYDKRKNILTLAGKNNLREYMLSLVENSKDYEAKEQEIGSEKMRYLEKAVALRVIDTFWEEHLTRMEELRDSVKLRAYGQKDPLVEYKSEGHRMFLEMVKDIDLKIIENILKAKIEPDNIVLKRAAAKTVRSVGRNDPCPCGAKDKDGKFIKYKKCCGR